MGGGAARVTRGAGRGGASGAAVYSGGGGPRGARSALLRGVHAGRAPPPLSTVLPTLQPSVASIPRPPAPALEGWTFRGMARHSAVSGVKRLHSPARLEPFCLEVRRCRAAVPSDECPVRGGVRAAAAHLGHLRGGARRGRAGRARGRQRGVPDPARGAALGRDAAALLHDRRAAPAPRRRPRAAGASQPLPGVSD